MTTLRSFERIDYTLRPAKHIERKMIGDALQRLRPVCDPAAMRYIGLGSTHFADFRLYHRLLGITDMVSIEESLDDADRMRFNKPFNSVKLHMGHSSEILPYLKWSKKTIIWLDYDDQLSAPLLQDIQTVCENALAGSVLIVTVNAHPPRTNVKPDQDEEAESKRFRNELGAFAEGHDIRLATMKTWGLADISYKIADSVIRESLSNRSRAYEEGQELDYRQLFHFRYEDGARMVTFGGLIFEESQRPEVETLDFSGLGFVRSQAEPYLIQLPQLTHRERRLLDQHLPPARKNGLEIKKLAYIPKRDRDRYAELYRYFPSFADADL